MKKTFFISIMLIAAFIGQIKAQTTITLQPDEENGKDAILHGLNGYTYINYGYSPQFTANAWTFSGVEGVVRSIIEFDLSGIPSGATVTEAYLSLYAWDSNSGFGQHSNLSGSNAFWIQRVTSNWDESTVCWNNKPSITTANQVSQPASTSPTQNYVDMDVTQLVQDMIDHPTSSFGFMIRLQNEAYYRRVNFASSDHSNNNLHPKLVVSYVINGTSANNMDQTNNVALFPVPTKDVLNICWTEQCQHPATIQLFNTTGQLIKTYEYTQTNTQLDLSFLPRGAYFVTIHIGDLVIRKKIIVE